MIYTYYFRLHPTGKRLKVAVSCPICRSVEGESFEFLWLVMLMFVMHYLLEVLLLFYEPQKFILQIYFIPTHSSTVQSQF